ncbi:MAG: membrane-bound lytic murein transglycosylase MltF [Desulfobacterales bacterium]|jgi:membrane-bound lytic murein transglycosylase F|nr:membrane-bound lytic murein transglycosylase MltF [Desulfobacterales bacterium]
MIRAERLVAFLAIFLAIEIVAYIALTNHPIPYKKPKSTLESILEKGVLTVLTRNAPTTYYVGSVGPMGYEYDMISQFADHLKVKLSIKTMTHVGEILQAIEAGDADIAAAGIAKTAERSAAHLFGPVYHSVQQQVVYRRGARRPRNANELAGYHILVIKDSRNEALLRELEKTVPGLTWAATDHLSIEEILEKLWRKEIDCTIADSNIVAINRRYFPELAVAFSLNEEEPLGWVLKPGSRWLREELADWFERFHASGKLSELNDHYFGIKNLLNYVDYKMFHRRIKSRLPRLMPLFLDASVNSRMPWELLAAQAYQESHWDNLAESPTGVKGIMMLTEKTAAAMGINDRVNPENSIKGGAAYLTELLTRIPETVNGENRVKFALAAYNVGLGHITDARDLAGRLGKNPDSWKDLQEVLPLLTQEKYYASLRNGYARGMEPVQYVNAIYTYRDILEKYFLLF